MTEENHQRLGVKGMRFLITALACLFLLGLAYKYYDDAEPYVPNREYVEGIDEWWFRECLNADGNVAEAGETVVYGIRVVRRKTQTKFGARVCKEQSDLNKRASKLFFACSPDYGNEEGEECEAYRAHYSDVAKRVAKAKPPKAWEDFKSDLKRLNKDIWSFVLDYAVFILIVAALAGYWSWKKTRS